MIKAPKIVQRCEGCHEQKRARYRITVDRYLCDACYYRPKSAPLGVPANSPQASSTGGQTDQTITVEALAVASSADVDAQFDLSHLTGGKRG